ncbi:MAG: hypothetical protein ABIO83_10180, partial [Ilumatobacteraceae bacterium]
ITLTSFFKQRRMSHENGITCRGTVRIVDDPTFPPNDFFQPGRTFPCRLRHATVLFKDDAKMTVRGASVKFADDRFTSPFDMLMNTGEVGLFWNARTFMEFGMMTGKHGKYFVSYLQKYPQALYGGGRSSRRDPESFHDLSFHSQTCFGFVDTAGRYHYCRYRLIGDRWDGTDSGALDPWWASHNWLQNPLPDEQRSRNYLKDRLIAQLDGDGSLTYRLQIQVRERPPGPEREWVSAEYEWHESVTPWHDLASITLTEALDYEEAMRTWFDLGNHPDSLPIPKGVSLDDPHSLNTLRSAGRWAARARLLSYRLRGMPKKFGDSRLDPDWDPVPPMPDPPGPRHDAGAGVTR